MLIGDIREFKSAFNYLEKSLKIRKQVYGENHLDTANSLEAKASVCVNLDLLSDAESLANIALKTYQEIFGNNHVRVSNCYMTLSTVFKIRGDKLNAKKYAERAFSTRLSLLGSGHSLTLQTKDLLGELE